MPDPTAQHRPKPVVGLLGAPGSGKSAVAAAFASLGCGVIDADQLARQAIERDEVKRQIQAWWGTGVLDERGTVDRAAVGKIVFDRPAELKRLEALTHPLVHAARHELRAGMQHDPAVLAIVEDCPLLLETGLETECDALILVDTPRHVREQRVFQTRGWSLEELHRRESRQWPLDIKRERADYVVQNDAGLDVLRTRVDQILRQILERFNAAPSH